MNIHHLSREKSNKKKKKKKKESKKKRLKSSTTYCATFPRRLGTWSSSSVVASLRRGRILKIEIMRKITNKLKTLLAFFLRRFYLPPSCLRYMYANLRHLKNYRIIFQLVVYTLPFFWPLTHTPSTSSLTLSFISRAFKQPYCSDAD